MLPPRNDNIASEADSLAVIGRNGLQQIWQIESHQQPKLGLCRQPRGSEPPPRMVEKGRRGQIVTQMRKLVPGAVSLPHLTLRMWGRASCPLNAKVSSERGWGGFIKKKKKDNLPTGPQLASAPFQPLHSRVQIQNRVFRGPEGGEGRTGWPEARSGGSGAVAILSSSRNTGLFLPSTLRRLSGSAGHLPSQVSSKPPQNASEWRGFRQGRPQR